MANELESAFQSGFQKEAFINPLVIKFADKVSGGASKIDEVVDAANKVRENSDAIGTGAKMLGGGGLLAGGGYAANQLSGAANKMSQDRRDKARSLSRGLSKQELANRYGVRGPVFKRGDNND